LGHPRDSAGKLYLTRNPNKNCYEGGVEGIPLPAASLRNGLRARKTTIGNSARVSLRERKVE